MFFAPRQHQWGICIWLNFFCGNESVSWFRPPVAPNLKTSKRAGRSQSCENKVTFAAEYIVCCNSVAIGNKQGR